jgi:dTDP-4-dehydrorhamnose 3,5-epimerase
MYAVDFERSIAWNDVSLGIKWPLDGNMPLLSQKDDAAPKLNVIKDHLHWPHEAYVINE